MKHRIKIKLSLFLCFIFNAVAFAESRGPRIHALSVYPIQLLYSNVVYSELTRNYSLQYQQAVSRRFSFSAIPTWGFKDYEEMYDDDNPEWGELVYKYGLDLGLQYNLLGSYLSGLYVGVYANVLKVSYTESDVADLLVGTSAMVGYQRYFGPGLFVSLGIGSRINHLVEGNDSKFGIAYYRYNTRTQAALGYAF